MRQSAAPRLPARKAAAALLTFCRCRERGEQGTTAVELALVVPLFLLLVFGTVDFGQAIVLFNVTGQSARDGARQGQVVVPHGQAAGPVTASQLATISPAASFSAGPLGSQLTVSAQAGTDSGGDYVQVKVLASYQPLSGRLLGINNVPVGGASKLYIP